jgi:hypothetical protein
MASAVLSPTHAERFHDIADEPRFPRWAALSRTRRRLWRTGLFALETAARTAAGDGSALLASWVAENLAALHGLDVRIAGELPATALVVVRSDEILAPLAVLARVPALPVLPAALADVPVLGAVLRELGAVFVAGDADDEAARRAATRALAAGTSVVWAARAPIPAVDAPVVTVDVVRADRPGDGAAATLATYVRTAARARTTLVIVPRAAS